ncbi:MAG TPA: glycosyltransferase family 4 protein [Pseudosphingobacterium sp.]|nr:glycosyltransferase family 4 protein [Pseudosphingobacterium sp.]
MNILITNCSSDLYGSSRILVIVMEALVKKNKVTLVLPEEGPLMGLIKEKKIDVKIVVMPNMPIVARRMNTISGLVATAQNYKKGRSFLKKIVKSEKIDICYVNTLAGFFLLRIFHQIGKRTVLHVHEILEKPKKITAIINKYSLKWADEVICVSQPVRDNICLFDKRGKSESKVKVIFNGIADQYMPVQQNKTQTVITLIGRITEAKGIWYFLETIATLPESIAKSCVFKIIGGPAPGKEHLIDKLENDIRSHRYKLNFIYIPFIEDVREQLNMTDILVAPSLMADPFPTTILEGLSAGKAIIATNGGGAVQSIESGVSGILIDRNDVKAFRESLESLVSDLNKRTIMGIKARERYLKCFQIEMFQNSISNIFN